MPDDEDTYAFRYWLLAGLSGEMDDETDVDDEDLNLNDLESLGLTELMSHIGMRVTKIETN
jgi:hypothetical protein